MEYKLANELRIAGFPQNKYNYPGVFLWEESWSAYAPTLEELIKECGKQLFRLEQGMHTGVWKWWAIGLEEVGIGDTHIEAVARLWLALNDTRSTAKSEANVK